MIYTYGSCLRYNFILHLETMVYKVENLDILVKKCIALLQKAFMNPPEPCWAVFMMDGCSFVGFKIFDPHLLQL